MKNARVAGMLVVMVSVFPAIGLSAEDRKSTNLAPNPGLEEPGTVEVPKGWSGKLPEGWSCYDNTPAEVGISDKIYHSGKHSAYLRITKFRDDDRVHTALVVGRSKNGYSGPEAIPVKPNTKYYYSFYIKGGGFSRKITVGPWGFKADGSGRDREFPSISVLPTEKWTHHVGSFTTKAETGRIILLFRFYGMKDRGVKRGATFYVDDVYIGTSEAAAKAEVPPAPGAEKQVPLFVPIKEPSLWPAGTKYGYTPLKEGTVRIWDAGKHWGSMWTAWAVSFKNKDKWKQVPYGITDYKFKGDTVLENKFFFISFNANSQNDLNVKHGKGTLWRNVIYKAYYNPSEYRIEKAPPGVFPKRFGVYYGDHTGEVKIIKNTPKEIIVENQADVKKCKYPITARYRVLADKPWVEVRPVKYVTDQGIHGKVRMAIAPIEGGNDWVLDSLRDPCGRPKAPPCKMIICFFESGTTPFMWVLTWTSPFKEAGPHFLNDSGPHGDTMWWGGTPGYPRHSPGCITSSWAKFGKNGAVVVGALAFWHNWHRDDINKPIKKGEVYTSKWKPPYPGHWRMTVRIAEKKYDQGFNYDGKTKFPAEYFTKDVYDGKFTFKSPKDGRLDYVIMYMYDRTKDTPKDVFTPMDQYRWTMKQWRGGK